MEIITCVCVCVSVSPVSVAPPLPRLVPSPLCPFVPDVRHTEDGRLDSISDTHTQRIHGKSNQQAERVRSIKRTPHCLCTFSALTSINLVQTVTWWVICAVKSYCSFSNMGAATDGAQSFQSIINRLFQPMLT